MCKQSYILNNRYNTNTTINRINDKKYVVTTTSKFIRELYNDDGSIYAIDFDGGPMIYQGHDIVVASELGKIKSITSDNDGYIIEFE